MIIKAHTMRQALHNREGKALKPLCAVCLEVGKKTPATNDWPTCGNPEHNAILWPVVKEVREILRGGSHHV